MIEGLAAARERSSASQTAAAIGVESGRRKPITTPPTESERASTAGSSQPGSAVPLLADFDAVLFDFGGVVANTAAVHAAAWKQVFDEFLTSWSEEQGVELVPFDVDADFVAYVEGRPRYECVAGFLRSRGIDLPYGSPDDVAGRRTCCGIGNRRDRCFADVVERVDVEVFNDSVALIDELRAAGKRLAVVSASESADALLRRAGMLEHFEVCVTGVDAMRLGLPFKPAPDMYLHAADELGSAVGRTVVLDDAAAGVRAARTGRFGFVIGVDRRDDAEVLRAAGADAVLTDLTTLLPIAPPDVVRGKPDVDALLDRTYEAMVFCLHPEVTFEDLGPLRDQLESAREGGLDVLVVVTDTRVATSAVGDAAASVHVVAPDNVSAAVLAALDRFAERGIGPGLVLVAGWLNELQLPEAAARVSLVSIDRMEPALGVLPTHAVWMGGESLGLVALVGDQLERRSSGRVPAIDGDPGWTVVVKSGERSPGGRFDSLLTVADGCFGTRGAREEESASASPTVVAAGVFDETPRVPMLLEGPIWTSLQVTRSWDGVGDTRLLDLRTGVLLREQPADPVPLRTFRFASLERPGMMAIRAEGGMDWLQAGPGLRPPTADGIFLRSQKAGRSTARTSNDRGGAIGAAACQRSLSGAGRRTIERMACYVADGDGADRTAEAAARLEIAQSVGFERLLAEHRAAWARRWRDAEVSITGDPRLELAVRFAIFHLMASARVDGEAAIGPRGLTGPAYGGHVFWDADVFVLPFLAATCPPAARAMLEYRIGRLPASRRAATAQGLAGARHAWESARDGTDVTPQSVRDETGTVVPIRTGQQEEHIVADVAWAAVHYAAWTGDDEFLRGRAAPLVLDAARYWAARIRSETVDGVTRGHLYGVIGPDEYHEPVDDNAFTNVMARWNLRQAARLGQATGFASDQEIQRWQWIADTLVDGYDGATGRYEQCAGFYALDDVMIKDFAETPVAADLLFGRPFVRRSQIVKQPDVLMLHHLVPDETAPGSLQPNLDFYEPRCSHGSSLSPAIHASLLARAGRPDEALRLFEMACYLDLDDLTGTTVGGLHIATFGGIWQALTFGFAGVRPARDGLVADPRLPSAWTELRMSFRYRGQRIRLHSGHDDFELVPEAPVRVVVPGSGGQDITASGRTWRRTADGWEVSP
jgi:HAD superfamily hydrolase (TIGR01509 family)